MLEGDDLRRAVPMFDQHVDGPDGIQLGQVLQRDRIAFLDFVVVGRVDESQGQDPLLLEVGLVDACERTGDDRRAAEVTRRHGSVLAAGAFAVILVSDDDPALAAFLVGAGDLGNVEPRLAGQDVLGLAALAGPSVDGPHEEVVGDLVEVAAVAQPGAGRRNMVGGRLALGLDENRHPGELRLDHGLEGVEDLEAFGAFGNLHRHGVGIVGRGDVTRLLADVAPFGKCVYPRGSFELEGLTVRQRDRVV
ncbi:hypothetical protein D3C87_1226620 [compost metagenome]